MLPLAAAALLPFLWLAARTDAAEFHVASGGNDAAAGSPGRPFATLQRAQRAVRELRLSETNPGPVTVVLHGGAYELAAPLRFGPEDSGTAESPVTYVSAPGERAVISGGRRLVGPWQPVAGKPIWQTAVPRLDGRPWSFNSLTVNGMSRERARQPNWGQKVLRAEGRAPGEDERQAFTYLPGDIDPGWANLTDVDLVLLCSWTPTIHRIREVLPERRVVRFFSSHARSVDAWERNFRYYVANVFEALDAPGEWYLDRATETLYYLPLPGEDLHTAEVIAPRLATRLLEFRGDVAGARFIEHLTFRDLDFRHVDGDAERHNGVYRQGHMFLGAAVYAEGLRSSVFVNCELAQLGEYALELGPGCWDNRIEQCHFWDLGAGAMQIGLTDLGALLSARFQPLPGDLVIEAETGALRDPMVSAADTTASGGACVLLPPGPAGGDVILTVTVPAAGRYGLFARVCAPGPTADSFVLSLNDGPRYIYDTGIGASWFLSRVVARELEGRPVVADLRPGANTITVAGREAGTKLDYLLLRPVHDGAEAAARPAAAEVLRNTVDNNLIHRLGTFWHGCYGIVNRFASFSRITHNDISDTHYTAIGLDARWTWNGELYSHGNEVAYNRLHHLGLGYHSDGGGVYQFGPLNTHIHHNVVHDTHAYPYICGLTGIYLDEQSRGALVENNLVYAVDWFAYFQHKGVDNVFRNNIGAFARDGFFLRGGLNEHWPTNSCEVVRNLYIARDAVAIKQSWEPGLVPPVLRQNLYFSTTTGTELTFAGESFADWQAAGQDAGSVLADPGCRDPERCDFTLRPDAAALTAIGFASFDEQIRRAGLYGDPGWTGRPGRLPRRTPNPEWTADELARFAAVRLDFEDMPEGWEPNQFTLVKEGEATFAVTSEAASAGRKSWKCVDRNGLRKPFYPYVHLAPKGLAQGRFVFSFDAMLAADTPARFDAEIRDGGSPYRVGPSLRVARDGAVAANDRPVFRVRPGTWFHLAVAFEFGAKAPKEYTLTSRYEGREERQTIPFGHEDFAEIRWLGICAAEDADGVFFLDNLVFDFE
jgi:hypothetical protein